MRVADSHCDTITAYSGDIFNSPEADWNILKFASSGGALQYMAVFIKPEYCGDVAMALAGRYIGAYYRQRPSDCVTLLTGQDYDESRLNTVLALEGGSPLINDLDNLYMFHKLGVRAITLTWNHRNFIGDGVDSEYGLTSFGKELVSEMEALRMIVDVSHLNESGFRDVCAISERPFMASHSNAWEICNHRRNLKDYQIREIIDRGGYIGLNFYTEFLSKSNDLSESRDDFKRNIEYYLELGAEKILGLGADFDGMDSSVIADASVYGEVEKILRDELAYDESLCERIMYKNLLDYTLAML